MLQPGIALPHLRVDGNWQPGCLGLAVDTHANRLVTVCSIDNLVKGTGGAAIQSMNIALGLPENTGLGNISLAKKGSAK